MHAVDLLMWPIAVNNSDSSWWSQIFPLRKKDPLLLQVNIRSVIIRRIADG